MFLRRKNKSLISGCCHTCWSLIQLTFCQTTVKPSKRCRVRTLNLNCRLGLKHTLGSAFQLDWVATLFQTEVSKFAPPVTSFYSCHLFPLLSTPCLPVMRMESRFYNELACLYILYVLMHHPVEGETKRVAGCSNHPVLLVSPPFPVALHLSLQVRVSSGANIDLGINYWTLSSFTPAPPPAGSDNLTIKEQRQTRSHYRVWSVDQWHICRQYIYTVLFNCLDVACFPLRIRLLVIFYTC